MTRLRGKCGIWDPTVPIKAELSVKNDDALYLTIQSVQMGKWIDVRSKNSRNTGESDYRIAFIAILLADRQIQIDDSL